MKNLIRLEEAAIFAGCVFLFAQLDFAWWVFIALLFVPDISMIGYAMNNKVGAIVYNVVHFRLIGLGIYIAGMYMTNEIVALSGLIMFAHSTLDRAIGYGLKHFSGFKDTHLGNLKSHE